MFLPFRQIVEDHAIGSGAACAGCVAARDKGRDTALQCSQFCQLGTNGNQMLLCKVTGISAGAGRVLHQRYERAHLINREPKLAAAPDEGELLQIGVTIDALTTRLAVR